MTGEDHGPRIWLTTEWRTLVTGTPEAAYVDGWADCRAALAARWEETKRTKASQMHDVGSVIEAVDALLAPGSPPAVPPRP